MQMRQQLLYNYVQINTIAQLSTLLKIPLEVQLEPYY
jgi:hypothetical protein